MAEKLASLQTITECEDGRFISNPFAGVLHIQPSCKESFRGLVIYSLTPLEITYIVRSLVGTLKVFSKHSLHVEPGLDGIFCQVIDPMPCYAGKHQVQVVDNNVG
jgi:hypothetical protein